MRINYSRKFKRDYRREKSGIYGKKLQPMLDEFLKLVDEGKPFPRRYFDHALSGSWDDCRDCHLKPDLVLIYRIADDGIVELIRLGSHSELGL
ncbi:MAG: type II toxin-antitoxin system YafQ family toxin [Alphaproteobacteria bacterium]|nr:type II toxin-antitoxin system YafQ family toxin [Alphaproteobacteria bacterium]